MPSAPGMIDHRTLLAQVRNTAPFLFADVDETAAPGGSMADLVSLPRGWQAILQRAARWPAAKTFKPSGEDYFCLCLAAHHATVGTFVPTDVDSKIRGTLWRGLNAQGAGKRAGIARQARAWTIDGINARTVTMPGHTVVSGHDGEHLAVAVAAWGALLAAGDTGAAATMEAVVADELMREAAAFSASIADGADILDALRLATILTHNAGDIDQGLGGWQDRPEMAAARARFARLAHREDGDFAGIPASVATAFTQAARLYKAVMAPEGHRNYPLRAVKELRTSADFLLPISPFLDGWGRMLATHPGLAIDGQVNVVEALVAGWRKVPGQQGYQRALAGFFAGWVGSQVPLMRRLADETKTALKGATLSTAMALPEEDFAEQLRERARAEL